MAKSVADHGVIIVEQVINWVANNPVDPPAGNVDQIGRSDAELALWHVRPYVVSVEAGWQVRCLDGKISDRPSRWEMVSDLIVALAFANLQVCL
jgi:hypothetical protein